jgi:hypothetical protein
MLVPTWLFENVSETRDNGSLPVVVKGDMIKSRIMKDNVL